MRRHQLAGRGQTQSHHEANLHFVRCLSHDFEVPKSILLETQGLTTAALGNMVPSAYGKI